MDSGRETLGLLPNGITPVPEQVAQLRLHDPRIQPHRRRLRGPVFMAAAVDRLAAWYFSEADTWDATSATFAVTRHPVGRPALLATGAWLPIDRGVRQHPRSDRKATRRRPRSHRPPSTARLQLHRSTRPRAEPGYRDIPERETRSGHGWHRCREQEVRWQMVRHQAGGQPSAASNALRQARDTSDSSQPRVPSAGSPSRPECALAKRR